MKRIRKRDGDLGAAFLYGARDRQAFIDIRDAQNWDSFPSWALAALRRTMARSVLGQALIRQFLVHVIGPIGPTPILDAVESEQDRMAIGDFWKRWARAPSVSGRETWSQFLRQMLHARVVDGRAFAIQRRHSDYPLGHALQPLGREWLDGFGAPGEQATRQYHGEKLQVDGGVGRSKSGRVKAYWFYKDAQQAHRQPWAGYSTGGWYSIPAGQTIAIAAENVIDFFAPVTPQDFHGTPGSLIPVVRLLAMIDTLDEAMMAAMQAATNRMGFFKGAPGSDPIPMIDDDPDAVPLPSEFENNVIEQLPPGYEFQAYDPAVPNAEIYKYRQEFVKNFAAAMGLNHASVSGDLSDVNFSSTRHGELGARDSFRLWHRDVEADICRPALYGAVETAVMTGRLSIGMDSLEQLAETEWRHRAWAWIDPLKDAMAARSLISMGVVSPQGIAAGLGADFYATVAELKAAHEAMQEAGLTPEVVQGLAGAGGSETGAGASAREAGGETRVEEGA